MTWWRRRTWGGAFGYNEGAIEKKKPTHDLEALQAAFTTVETLKVTGTAIRDAAALNLGRQEVVGIPQTLCPAHFYKSTTSDAD